MANNIYLKEIQGENITDVGFNRRRCCSCGPCCSIPYKDFVDTGNYGIKYYLENAYGTNKLTFHDELFYGAKTEDGMVYYSCLCGSPMSQSWLSGTVVTYLSSGQNMLSNGLRNSDVMEYINYDSIDNTTSIPDLFRATTQGNGDVHYPGGPSDPPSEWELYNHVYTRANFSIRTGCWLYDIFGAAYKAKSWILNFNMLEYFTTYSDMTSILTPYGYDYQPYYEYDPLSNPHFPYRYKGAIWAKDEVMSNGVTLESRIATVQDNPYHYSFLNQGTILFYEQAELDSWEGDTPQFFLYPGSAAGTARNIIDMIPMTVTPSFNPCGTSLKVEWWNP